MFTKRKKEDVEPKEEAFDVSSMLGAYEEKPIMIVDDMATAPSAAPRAPSLREIPLEVRLKEDLKMSYEASGILDVTFGGYGFLRKEYAINPNEDIYVSTSQIRRFWLRKGDLVEGLARPPKEGERFHSLLLIKKIN